LITAEGTLLLISGTLFLSYISGIIYNKTKIPDLVWLLGFGMLLGPVLHVYDEQVFTGIFDLMLLLSVTLFSFGTGININTQQLVGSTRKAASLAFASFVTVTVSTGLVVHYALPDMFSLMDGLILGAMMGAMSGVSLSSLVSAVKSSYQGMGNADVLLQMESTIGDPLRVVAVLTLIKMVLVMEAGPRTAARDILFLLLSSVAIGVVSGLGWGELLSRLRDRPLNYMMTMAFVFPVYELAEYVGGSGGAIAVMVMGIVVMNYGYVTRFLKLNRKARIDRRKIQEYHNEITFLVKSMFFVYMGIIVRLSVVSLAVGVLVASLIVLTRYVSVSLVGLFHRLTPHEVAFTRMIFIQGAGTLVLSQFPAKFDPLRLSFTNPDIFTDLAIPIVIVSILFSSVVAPIIAHRQLLPKKKPREAPVNGVKENGEEPSAVEPMA